MEQVFTKEVIKDYLKKNKNWQLRALVRLYERQTDMEKDSNKTIEHNGIGFSGADAKILTGIFKFYKANNFLTEKQYTVLSKRLPKYWGQVKTLIEHTQKK